MIFFEGPRVISPSVWARGGQAPLRAQAFLLSWHCLSAIQASSRPILAGRDAEAGERRWPERGRPRRQAFVRSPVYIVEVRRDRSWEFSQRCMTAQCLL